MTKTDWIFVQQAKKGDSHAFARLYEIYYKDLYHFALYYTKDSITAEDAVSSAVLKAFEQLHKLRKNDAFKSWRMNFIRDNFTVFAIVILVLLVGIYVLSTWRNKVRARKRTEQEKLFKERNKGKEDV
mgnify:CR=1 FL=1